MPRSEAPTSIGDQLRAALDETGVSARELGRRLAEQDGDTAKAESKRRWLQKVLRDEVDRPNMAPVAKALKKPTGYFKVPEQAPRGRRASRLAELEEEVASLRQQLESFVEAATERQADREVPPAPATRRSTQRLTPRGR